MQINFDCLKMVWGVAVAVAFRGSQESWVGTTATASENDLIYLLIMSSFVSLIECRHP